MPKLNLSEASLKIREQTTALFAEYSSNPSIKLRNQIVELNAGMVHRTARKYAAKVDPSITTKEEFTQLGFIGLTKAVERFDTTKDGAFVSFAGKYIEGEMQHHNRSIKGIVKVPVAMTEKHSEVLKYQRAIQKLKPDETITIEYVLETCPQLGLTMDDWRKIDRASKPQHYAPIDCQSELDPYVQLADEAQNTIEIEAEKEEREQKLASVKRRMLYALDGSERAMVDELMLGVSIASIAIRHDLKTSECQRILENSITKLQCY